MIPAKHWKVYLKIRRWVLLEGERSLDLHFQFIDQATRLWRSLPPLSRSRTQESFTGSGQGITKTSRVTKTLRITKQPKFLREILETKSISLPVEVEDMFEECKLNPPKFWIPIVGITGKQWCTLWWGNRSIVKHWLFLGLARVRSWRLCTLA